MNERIRRSILYLAEIGVSEKLAAPPLLRYAWKIGINIPPLYFLERLQIFILISVLSAVAWAPIFYLTSLIFEWNQIKNYLVASSVIFGGVFGLYSAIYYNSKRRDLKIPIWKNF